MITPVIIAYNEEANIQPTLNSLAWANRIVVLDSGSTDRTEEISRSFGNVSWFVRPFDDHRSQWLFAIHNTAISTEYILALDADMRPGTGFVSELEQFLGRGDYVGALVPFEYRVLGKDLAGSLYPPQVRIFRRAEVSVEQLGHTQVFSATGQLYRFRSSLVHEDRKPMARWLRNQVSYAALEANRIRSAARTTIKDRLRLAGVSPAIWCAYAYLRAGGPLKAPGSRAYAYERLIFEAILARLLAGSQSPSDLPTSHP